MITRRSLIILTVIFFLNTFVSVAQTHKDSLNFNLIVAAEQGNEKEVLKCLKNGANVNAVTFDGISALMYASQNGYLNIVKILIYNGSNINQRPPSGVTALSGATQFNRLDVMEYLLTKGANPNIKDNDSIAPLLYAVTYNYLDAVNLLFLYGADILTSAKDGTNAMHIACLSGYSQITDLLIKRGMPIENPDFANWTPLHCVAQSGSLDAAKDLISNGAKINELNSDQCSPLTIAIMHKNQAFADYLLKNNADPKIKINKKNLVDIAKESNSDSIARILRKEYKIKSNRFLLTGVYFSPLNFSIGQNEGLMNYKIGSNTSFFNTNIYLTFFNRYKRQNVTIQTSAYQYYQYREQSYMPGIGINKAIYLYSKKQNKIGLIVGMDQVIQFKNWHGVDYGPKTVLKTTPYSLLTLKHRAISLNLGTRYLKSAQQKNAPWLFDFGISFTTNKPRMISTKKLYWIE